MAAPASLSLALLLASAASVSGSGKVRNVYWNTSTTSSMGGPITVTVNEGNLPWEYDQLNLICPRDSAEQHVIYSVDRQQFERCRVTGARPRIVAVCNQLASTAFMYFTITFRSFTPTPGGLEFRPGQEYFFISTASQRDIHRRVGGWCSSHNMRMVVKVAENGVQDNLIPDSTTRKPRPIPTPAAFWSKYWVSRVPDAKEQYRHSLQDPGYPQTREDTYWTEDRAARSHPSSAASPVMAASTALVLLLTAWTLRLQ